MPNLRLNCAVLGLASVVVFGGGLALAQDGMMERAERVELRVENCETAELLNERFRREHNRLRFTCEGEKEGEVAGGDESETKDEGDEPVADDKTYEYLFCNEEIMFCIPMQVVPMPTIGAKDRSDEVADGRE